MTSTKQRSISRGDSGALIGFCLAGIGIAAYITMFSIARIVELARGVDVPVEDSDPRTVGSTSERGRTTDSGATTGDQYDLSGETGLQDAMAEALFAAYFIGGRDVSDDAVLREMGLGDADIARLRALGVVA